MKISSTLLTAMLISATVGIASGCKTAKDHNSKKNAPPHNIHKPTGDECPGCGMG